VRDHGRVTAFDAFQLKWSQPIGEGILSDPRFELIENTNPLRLTVGALFDDKRVHSASLIAMPFSRSRWEGGAAGRARGYRPSVVTVSRRGRP
jgi:hypothetical protein